MAVGDLGLGVRRGRFEILLDVLRQVGRPIQFKEVMRRANLSGSLTKDVLQKLSVCGLVQMEVRCQHVRYFRTEVGKQALDQMNKIMEMFEGGEINGTSKSGAAARNGFRVAVAEPDKVQA